jgi:hypothetical protein
MVLVLLQTHELGAKRQRIRPRHSRVEPILCPVVICSGDVPLRQCVALIAMPALARLLILVGYRTITQADLVSVWKTGKMLAATFGRQCSPTRPSVAGRVSAYPSCFT